MGEVFIGSEAIAAGRLTRHELQRWYRPIYRGIYVPKHSEPSLRDQAVGAWLASDRRGVIAGAAASALHGAQWVDDGIPIELISSRARRQRGLEVRDETLGDDEVTWVGKLPVTTRVRTAFDLGRYRERGEAIARLDALMRAQLFRLKTCCCWPNAARHRVNACFPTASTNDDAARKGVLESGGRSQSVPTRGHHPPIRRLRLSDGRRRQS